MPNLVVVEANPNIFWKIIGRRLQKQGIALSSVLSRNELVSYLTANQSTVVLVEADHPEFRQIKSWVKINSNYLLSVVAIYREGQGSSRPDCLDILEDEVLVEPFDADQIEKVFLREQMRIQEERVSLLRDVTFIIPARTSEHQSACQLIESLLAESGLSRGDNANFSIAFSETLDNAIRHGSKAKPNSLVTVSYVLDKQRVIIVIADEGKGFDTKRFINQGITGQAVDLARQRYKDGGYGGLGISMILRVVDRLEYNETGNIAKIMKWIRKPDHIAQV